MSVVRFLVPLPRTTPCMLGDNESEIELADRAVALNANLYFGWQNRGCGLQIAGLHEEALRSFECAMRLPMSQIVQVIEYSKKMIPINGRVF